MIDEKAVLDFVNNYRGKTASKIANPYVFGVLALLYAYKGKLGKIERGLLGAAGLVTIYSNYKNIEGAKKADGVLSFLEEYAKGSVADKVDVTASNEMQIAESDMIFDSEPTILEAEA